MNWYRWYIYGGPEPTPIPFSFSSSSTSSSSSSSSSSASISTPIVNSGATAVAQTAETHTFNVPTHSEGDVIYVFASAETTSGTMTAPSGYSAVFQNVSSSGSRYNYSLWRKAAGASEPATDSWTVSGSQEGCTIAWSVTNDGGVDGNATTQGNSSTVTCPDFTATVANVLVLRLVTTDKDTLPHGLAPGHTWIDDIADPANCISVQYETKASSGSVGSESISISASEEWDGITVVVKPG